MTPHVLPVLDPALFGDVGGPDMVVVDLRAPRGEAEPFDVIRGIVDRGQAACLYDREGRVSDCVVAKVEGAVFVITVAGRATFSDLGAALRHGLSQAVALPSPAPKATRPSPRRA